MVRRIALEIEYDGSAFSGWQLQKNAFTVQQALQEALARLLGTPTGVTGASRTDAGVSALGQVAHFDTCSRIPAHKFCFALNTMLPKTVRVVSSWEAPADFHARFSAKGKTYDYKILNRPHHSALLYKTHAHVPLPLDVQAMQAAAQQFIGLHDFHAFMAVGGTSKTFSREMHISCVEQQGDVIQFTIAGTGFLYNMVRIMAGTLIEIGQGKREISCIQQAFASGSRLCLGQTAPAEGLTLRKVHYE